MAPHDAIAAQGAQSTTQTQPSVDAESALAVAGIAANSMLPACVKFTMMAHWQHRDVRHCSAAVSTAAHRMGCPRSCAICAAHSMHDRQFCPAGTPVLASHTFSEASQHVVHLQQAAMLPAVARIAA
jgi:hypothetical protein